VQSAGDAVKETLQRINAGIAAPHGLSGIGDVTLVAHRVVMASIATSSRCSLTMM
jgi:hypothetical protein